MIHPLCNQDGDTERPAGQKDVLGFGDTQNGYRTGWFYRLGMRGPWCRKAFYVYPRHEDRRTLATCHADRVEKTQTILDNAGLPRAAAYSGSEDAWKELCQRDDIDLVYIATDWKTPRRNDDLCHGAG